MDITGVNDDWDLQVNPLMQDMQHRDDEYFNPQEVGGNILKYMESYCKNAHLYQKNMRYFFYKKKIIKGLFKVIFDYFKIFSIIHFY
jgi:hypothetical protein